MLNPYDELNAEPDCGPVAESVQARELLADVLRDEQEGGWLLDFLMDLETAAAWQFRHEIARCPTCGVRRPVGVSGEPHCVTCRRARR